METNEQSVLLFVVVLLTAGGIAFFHGYEYLEKEKINVQGFPKADLQNMVIILLNLPLCREGSILATK